MKKNAIEPYAYYMRDYLNNYVANARMKKKMDHTQREERSTDLATLMDVVSRC